MQWCLWCCKNVGIKNEFEEKNKSVRDVLIALELECGTKKCKQQTKVRYMQQLAMVR